VRDNGECFSPVNFLVVLHAICNVALFATLLKVCSAND
jgi:hypothetical protein